MEEFLTEEEKTRIQEAIAKAEETTAGEIRVVVANNSKNFESTRKHAEEAFRRYGLHLTKDQTGILIFISVEEKRIEILADKGIDAKVPQFTWDNMVNRMIIRIRSNATCQGICELVQEAGKLLTTHFPIQPDDVNELPNEVIEEK